ncbi:MAG: transposase-like protein [Saprospiraceae bacterium]|jgi:transposase-like protein
MKRYQEIGCPQYRKTDLVKNGYRENGTQRYHSKNCKKSFQKDYSYQACTPGIKDKIDAQILIIVVDRILHEC